MSERQFHRILESPLCFPLSPCLFKNPQLTNPLPSRPDTTASHSRSSLARTVPIKGQKVLTGRVTKASRNPVKKEIDKDDGVIEVGDHDEVEVLDGEDIDALVKKEEGGDGEEEDEDEE